MTRGLPIVFWRNPPPPLATPAAICAGVGTAGDVAHWFAAGPGFDVPPKQGTEKFWLMLTWLFGTSKLGWLKMLKNCASNFNRNLSVSLKFFATSKSKRA